MVGIKKNDPHRGLSEVELQERQVDLEKALNLFGSVARSLNKAAPLVEAALEEAEQLRQMCERNPVLRAAMVSRRLSVQMLIQDIRNAKFKVSTISKSVGKLQQSRVGELEQAVRDPELLR